MPSNDDLDDLEKANSTDQGRVSETTLDIKSKSQGDYTESKWINNEGEEVKEVFGFNKNAELINARAAMFGFLMLLITELIFKGEATTSAIFGIH